MGEEYHFDLIALDYHRYFVLINCLILLLFMHCVFYLCHCSLSFLINALFAVMFCVFVVFAIHSIISMNVTLQLFVTCAFVISDISIYSKCDLMSQPGQLKQNTRIYMAKFCLAVRLP